MISNAAAETLSQERHSGITKFWPEICQPASCSYCIYTFTHSTVPSTPLLYSTRIQTQPHLTVSYTHTPLLCLSLCRPRPLVALHRQQPRTQKVLLLRVHQLLLRDCEALLADPPPLTTPPTPLTPTPCTTSTPNPLPHPNHPVHLSTNFPPVLRAYSQLNSAVRAPPTCRLPVGEGAKRTLI